ncbi:hypothetical protein ACQUQU_03890 [Thalassolituus sp. LLYu03]|uniref:hypothetical protein n=1 Tax=Thalassolituus sp. LLYu03 TaxID=3421656 RepID=UPI003D266449
MKNIQKLVLPALVSLAGLSAFEAHATTTAGTLITNTATLGYQVNGIQQTEVEAKADVAVDVKIDFTVTRSGSTINGSALQTYNSADYYVAGVFVVANTGNTPALFTLTAAELAAATNLTYGSDTETDTIDLDSGNYVIVADNDGSAGLTDTDADVSSASLTLPQDQSTGTTVYVLAPKASVVGVDEDVLGVTLTGTVGSVTRKVWNATSGSYDPDTTVTIASLSTTTNTLTGVELVVADADKDNTESATDALKLSFPSFPEYTDDGDNTNDGFVKSVEVVWDPFNGTSDPKAIPEAIVKYTLVVKNLGNMAATNLEVTDPLTAELTYCSTTPADAVADSITCALTATAPAGGSVTDAAPTTAGDASGVTVTYGTFSDGNTSTITFYAIVK